MRLLALALVLPLAGCIASPGAVEPASLPEPAQALGDRLAALLAGVPCEVDAVGDETTENLKLLATFDLKPSGRLGALHFHGSLMLNARYDAGGFHLADASDPLEPRLLGTFEDFPGPALDAKFTTDGTGVLVANLDGIAVVDVRDPRGPVKESEWALPDDLLLQAQGRNAHRLWLYDHAGRALVFLAPNANAGVWILELEGPPGARQLRMLTRFAEHVNGPIGPHDMYVAMDEDLGIPILWVANGFAGWLAADVSDPAAPRLLGGAAPLDPFQSYVHTIKAVKLDGRRIVATISEVGFNGLKVYDASDLRAPRLLAAWSSRPVATGPQHFFQVVDGKLVLAHYRDGGYVFDLRRLPAAPLPGLWGPMARFVIGPDPGPLYGFDGVYDAAVKDGLVHFVERERGIHVLGFGCFAAGDPALTSAG